MKIYNYTRVLNIIKQSIIVNTIFGLVVLFLSLYFNEYDLFNLVMLLNICLFGLNYGIKTFVMYKVRKLYRSGKIGYNEVKAVGNIVKENSIC